MDLLFGLLDWIIFAFLLWGAIKISEPHNPVNKFSRALQIGILVFLLFTVSNKLKVSDWIVEVLILSALSYLLIRFYKMNIKKSIIIVVTVFFIHCLLGHIFGPLISPS